MSTFIDRDGSASGGGGGGGNIPGAMIRSGILTVTLPVGQTDDFNDASLSTVSVIRVFTNVGDSTLTGITAQASGFVLSLANKGSGNLMLLDQSASSSPNNRFSFLDVGDFIAPPGASIDLWYDIASLRWILL